MQSRNERCPPDPGPREPLGMCSCLGEIPYAVISHRLYQVAPVCSLLRPDLPSYGGKRAPGTSQRNSFLPELGHLEEGADAGWMGERARLERCPDSGPCSRPFHSLPTMNPLPGITCRGSGESLVKNLLTGKEISSGSSRPRGSKERN